MSVLKEINRRQLLQGGLCAATLLGAQSMGAEALAGPEKETASPKAKADISNSLLSIWAGGGADCLWQFKLQGAGRMHRLAPPVFPLNGLQVTAGVEHFHLLRSAEKLPHRVTLYAMEGEVQSVPGLRLGIDLELNDTTSVIRFRYTLRSETERRLTRQGWRDELQYCRFSLRGYTEIKEISLSRFSGQCHCYQLEEETLSPRWFEDEMQKSGPILAATDGRESFLIAYEHGSQAPDDFLQFALGKDGQVRLVAVKGNYLRDQAVDAAHPFQTLWFEAGATPGGIDALASTYRTYVLNHLARNSASRQPYIFYNTWNLQERDKWFHRQPYLASIEQERMGREIDVAHRMGIDVFVIDTGWYVKTGDWEVDRTRFPDGLKSVKAELDGYGMQLGLWIGPTTCAETSRIACAHPEWRASWDGTVYAAEAIWETEGSFHMCMASDYSDALADELIRLAKETGLRYLKWDWDDIHHHPCNDPGHLHGSEHHTPEERHESYRYQLIQRMTRLADRIAEAVPNLIIEFDITEEGRAMGLSFLSSGKFFQLNNGPYYFDYDVPIDKAKDNWNLFFHQGQARAWIMRSQLVIDKWLPSVLFLTHYFPDDPAQWQDVNIASLLLGHNGIWGDLTTVSDAGVERIGKTLRMYKEIAGEITASDPVRSGVVSGSPEVHEKIASSGKGAVVIFATMAGSYVYVTEHSAAKEHWKNEGVLVSFDGQGRAKIEAAFDQPGAKIVLFGVSG